MGCGTEGGMGQGNPRFTSAVLQKQANRLEGGSHGEDGFPPSFFAKPEGFLKLIHDVLNPRPRRHHPW
ncbi:hypothetical protein U1Q18_005944 [Sarracenia purpurea var. burkii]